MKTVVTSTALLLSLAAGPAIAQDVPSLVTVDLRDALRDISVELNIEETNIPVTVQLPVSVAANVCNVDVNLLTQDVEQDGAATCTAVSSQELTQIVQMEMTAGGGSTGDTATSDSQAAAPGQSGQAPGRSGNTPPGQLRKAAQPQ